MVSAEYGLFTMPRTCSRTPASRSSGLAVAINYDNTAFGQSPTPMPTAVFPRSEVSSHAHPPVSAMRVKPMNDACSSTVSGRSNFSGFASRA